MSDIIVQAREFALAAHGNQKRKYTGLPYVTHLDAVASILKRAGITDPNTLAATYLHDTVEDTTTTMQMILERFGTQIGQLVFWLTDSEKGDRKTRTLLYAWRLARAPWDAKMIKLADIIDNCSSIRQHDPDFAQAYLDEKRQVIRLMADVEKSDILQHPLFLEAVLATDFVIP